MPLTFAAKTPRRLVTAVHYRRRSGAYPPTGRGSTRSGCLRRGHTPGHRCLLVAVAGDPVPVDQLGHLHSPSTIKLPRGAEQETGPPRMPGVCPAPRVASRVGRGGDYYRRILSALRLGAHLPRRRVQLSCGNLVLMSHGARQFQPRHCTLTECRAERRRLRGHHAQPRIGQGKPALAAFARAVRQRW